MDSYFATVVFGVMLLGLVILVLVVAIFARGATKADVQRVENEVRELEGEVEAKFESERGTARGALSAVHKRIDTEVIKVAEMRGAFAAVQEGLSKLESKIDRLIEGKKP